MSNSSRLREFEQTNLPFSASISTESQQLDEIPLQIVSPNDQREALIFDSSYSRSHQEDHTVAESNMFSMLSIDSMIKIIEFVWVETASSLFRTCTYFQSDSFKTLFHSKILSKDFQNQASKRYFDEALRYKHPIYFYQSVKLFKPNKDIPNCLTIGIFTSVKGPKIASDDVFSIIIQFYKLPENYSSVLEFIESFLQKERFKNLQSLMFVGIPADKWLASLLQKLSLTLLNLKVFTKRNVDKNFIFDATLEGLDNLEKLCITHPSQHGLFQLPTLLKKIIVYCPKSNQDPGPNDMFGLKINSPSSLTHVETYAHPEFKHKLHFWTNNVSHIENLIWDVPCSAYIRWALLNSDYKPLQKAYLKCPKAWILEKFGDEELCPIVSGFLPVIRHYLDGSEIPVSSCCQCGNLTEARKLPQ